MATDIGFGPDGNVYVADWVEGWDGVNKGRIYRLRDPQAQTNKTVAEVKTLLAEGIAERGERVVMTMGPPISSSPGKTSTMIVHKVGEAAME